MPRGNLPAVSIRTTADAMGACSDVWR
jgi:hypothetical protein